MKKVLALCMLALVAACGAPQPAETAPEPGAAGGQVAISDSWASPTPGGVDVSAGYLTIANGTDAEDRLTGAESPRAARVELHEMAMGEGGVMQMRPLDGIAIAAGASESLAPGGRHLMFVGVSQPFTPGEEIPVTLKFERAGDVAVNLPVRPGGRMQH